LDPDILIVDEVLAVGDFLFQQKCLARWGGFDPARPHHSLRSHNLAAVQKLLFHCILLETRSVVAQGPPTEIIRRYLDQSSTAADGEADLAQLAQCDVRLSVRDLDGQPTRVWQQGQHLCK
jgi:lipopolysaccharide transport system ATP-binding protein